MKNRSGLLIIHLGLGMVLSLSAATVAPPRQEVFHHEHVLGTSLELRVRSSVEGSATQAESVVLKEIDRLARIFSGYSPDTEFSRWQRSYQQPVKVSPELFTVLQASEHWRIQSGGAFNPTAEAFTKLWKTAAQQNSQPDPSDLKAMVLEAAQPTLRLDSTAQTAERLSKVPLTLNALAKGYIIEQASAKAARVPGVEGLLLEIGGDLRVRGRFAEPVSITDPHHGEENAAPLTTVLLHDRALATSGGYRRGVNVRGQHFSHILDPRTGEPVTHVAGVTVMASDATTADALSTTFSVLDPEESLRLAESTPDVACLLVLSNGQQRPSSRWPAENSGWTPLAERRTNPPTASASSTGQASMELAVSFEISRVEGGRYQRPYVAAWIEDKDGFPVRTLLLWLLQSEKGQRWIPDLRRWHRGDQMRRLTEDKDLVATVSGATRNPGKYNLIWDGKDDHGDVLKPGTYTFHLESAREHGTYQWVKHEFTVGGNSFAVVLKDNEELKGVTLEYRRPSNRK